MGIKQESCSLTNMLEIKNLTCGYGAKIILKDINFSVKEQELIGVIGPNG